MHRHIINPTSYTLTTNEFLCLVSDIFRPSLAEWWNQYSKAHESVVQINKERILAHVFNDVRVDTNYDAPIEPPRLIVSIAGMILCRFRKTSPDEFLKPGAFIVVPGSRTAAIRASSCRSARCTGTS